MNPASAFRRWWTVVCASALASFCLNSSINAQESVRSGSAPRRPSNLRRADTARYRTGARTQRSVLLKQPRRIEEDAGEDNDVGKLHLASLQEPVEAEELARGEIEELATGDLIEGDDLGIVYADGAAPSGSVYFEPQSGNRIRYWLSAEYLYWWAKGMDVPPLVTTSPAGTAATDAGVLGRPNTRILYGDGRILTEDMDGFRVRLGTWFDRHPGWGIGGEYLRLLTQRENFTASSNATGSPILARPFFNMNPRNGAGTANPPAREDAEIVSSPNVARGTVMVDSSTRLDSGALYLVRSLNPTDPCGNPMAYDPCGNQTSMQYRLGYRYARLREHLRITENLTSLNTDSPGTFAIYDHFQTENEFHGGELAVSWTGQYRRWSMDVLLALAVGSNRQTVDINGQTTFSAGSGSQMFQGGLLAQRSNIGIHKREVLSVIPQFGANLGFEVRPGLRLTAGYTFFYWSRVVRPGDQIDLDVNPDLLPPERVPFEGPLRPQFAFRDTDYWAHGLTAGFDLRW